jgi:AraC-like DNA-binding protein
MRSVMNAAAAFTWISLFGSLQALVLGLAILARRGGTGAPGAEPARRLRVELGGVVIVFGAAVASIALDHSGWLSASAPLVWIEYTLAWCFPLFLLYARSAVGRPVEPRRVALHAVPLALWLLQSLAGAFAGGLPWWPPILFVVLYQVAYTVRVAWLAFVDAPLDAPGLGLLRLMTGGVVVIHLAQAVRFVYAEVEVLRDVVPLAATAVLYVVVYRALAVSEILHPPPRPYAASGLDPGRAGEEARRLERLMESERLYTRPDLDLDGVARRMGVSRTHLSQIVNQGLGATFNELVKRHRVAEAERLLSDPGLGHLTVQAIGERAGFSSRSAFYEAFREQTGSTPGRYRERRS